MEQPIAVSETRVATVLMGCMAKAASKILCKAIFRLVAAESKVQKCER
jgi:hypothetical protein